MMKRYYLLLLATLFMVASATAADLTTPAAFIEHHCQTCHGSEEPEGDIALDPLPEIDSDSAKLWQNILTQIAAGEMPPDGEERPELTHREAVIRSIFDSMAKANLAPQLPGGPLPQDGNLIDHDRLFSGHFKGPAYSPPRYWRRSQSQYDALMEHLWVIPKLRYEKAHTKSDPEWAAYSYSQPFPGLDPAHFTNYSADVHADEAALRALLDAGGQIAIRLTSDKTAYARELQPPHAVGVPSIRRGSHWEKFKVEPPPIAKEFQPFVDGLDRATDEQIAAAVSRSFRLLLNRPPNAEEQARYGELLRGSVKKSGSLAAIRGLLTAVFVSPEFVFRLEIGMTPPDEHGRRMLSPNELVYAISYALTDDGPDQQLWSAATDGRLATRADVEREVRRMLADDSIEKHPRLRFFQEFFGYHRAVDVFKDKPGWDWEVRYLVRDADLLVEHVLRKDKQVFAELLTTDKFFVAYPNIRDPELFEAIIQKTIEEAESSIEKTKQRGRKVEPPRNGGYSRAWAYLQGYDLIPRTVHNDRGSAEMSYIRVYGFDGSKFNWTRNQPIDVPGRRAGMLTHPAWLVAHSTNFDNYVVGRGHWIRERLLAGKIPDVPIDVEAQVPDEPNSTLRERMRVTREERCVRCHRRMDPLGFPFEIYDHYGQFREQEMVGTRKNQPREIDPSGEIIASGEASLDGNVDDAIDLAHKLADSPRVRQSIIRHAFRFWMGRNEMLSDSPTLIAADQAYVEHDGSFQEMLVSLLTSDSFLYRK